MRVQRVVMPASPVESWTVLGDDGAPVGPVERYLAYLTAIERSSNTIRAYAFDLKDYWVFLRQRGLDWEEVRLEDIGEYVAWLRLPTPAPWSKLVVDEDGSDLAAELWDGCDAALASRLAYPEVRAALAAACRSEADLDAAEQAWEQYWAARPVELTAAVEHRAGTLARSHALRGDDAVHLASALAVGDPDLTLAVWDRRLHAGAATAGLSVAPAHLPAT